MRGLVIVWLCGCATLPTAPPPGTLVPVQGAALLDSSPPPRSPDTPLPGPVEPLAPAGPADGQVGTAHQAFVPDADPAGRWALVCQAREDTNRNGWIGFGIVEHGIIEGDEAALYLVRGSGTGERIEGVIARDASGRWLVVARADGGVVLVDIERGTGMALYSSSESVHEELYPLAPATIAFDPSGRWLLYRRSVRGRVMLVVRQLESGDERVVDPGPGTLVTAGWRGSAWLRLEVVRDDFNNDGRIDVPEDHRGTWVGTCGIGSTTYMAGWSEDVSHASVAWSTGLRVEGEGHRGFGDELLIREGGIWFAVATSGARRAMAVADGCWPIFGDADRGRVIADCGKEDETVLAGFDADGRREIGRIGGEWFQLEVLSPRVVLLHAREVSNQLLDLEQLRLTPVSGWVFAAHGSRVLVQAERNVLVDTATGRRRLLRGPEYVGALQSGGRYAFAAPWIVDLERGRQLGWIERRVHAITMDGRVLVETRDRALRWTGWREAVDARRR